MKRILFVIVALAVSMAVGIFLFTKPGCACGELFPDRIHRFSVLNPIRDRAPEKVAEAFLQEQSQGKCLPTVSDLCSYALNSHALRKWRLAAREDSKRGVILYYYVQARDLSSEHWREAAVAVDREAGDWRVSGYTAIF